MAKLKNIFTTFIILFCGIAVSQNDVDDFSENVDGESSSINISGIVTDLSTGNPLAGSNIVVGDSDLGAATDEDGRYTIEGVKSGEMVTASAIGYEDLVLYADQAELNFELAASISSLNTFWTFLSSSLKSCSFLDNLIFSKCNSSFCSLSSI